MPLPTFRIAILISIASLLIIAIGCGGGYGSGQGGGNPNPVPAVASKGSSDRPFHTVPVNSSGVASPTLYGGEFRLWGPHLKYDSTTTYIYSDTGEVVDPASGRPVGNYADGWAQPFSSLSTIDPAQKRALF